MKMEEPGAAGALRRGRLRIAVVGGGISGLAAAWLLSRRHDVTLYEAGDNLGGHTNTIDVSLEGRTCPVDTGFLVFNRNTYPNLCALFRQIGIKSVTSEMSFSVSLAEPDMEWAGNDLFTLFAQPHNLLRPAFLTMVRDILRFNRETSRLVRLGELPDVPLGEYLEAEAYSPSFRDWYLLPMAAAIWSCPTATMLAYPLITFVQFCRNHGLLQMFDRPQWLSVMGGGRAYVQRLARDLSDVRCGSPVLAVARDGAGVLVSTRYNLERFDELVLACHSDQALRLLGQEADPVERAVLGAVGYQSNVAWLHTDTRLLPRRRKVWSAWNYAAGKPTPDGAPVAVSYLINRLQPLPFETPVVVSLNPLSEPQESSVISRMEYAHPVFDRAAIGAQARLPEIQGRRHTWFAGAWTGHGFHEDGLKSALEVAGRLGAGASWLAVRERAEVA